MPSGRAAAVPTGWRSCCSTNNCAGYRQRSAHTLDMPRRLLKRTDLKTGLAVLDAMDLEAVSHYQPYWAVRAHLLQRIGRPREAADAYDRAIGLAEDTAVKEFLLQRRG